MNKENYRCVQVEPDTWAAQYYGRFGEWVTIDEHYGPKMAEYQIEQLRLLHAAIVERQRDVLRSKQKKGGFYGMGYELHHCAGRVVV